MEYFLGFELTDKQIYNRIDKWSEIIFFFIHWTLNNGYLKPTYLELFCPEDGLSNYYV